MDTNVNATKENMTVFWTDVTVLIMHRYVPGLGLPSPPLLTNDEKDEI